MFDECVSFKRIVNMPLRLDLQKFEGAIKISYLNDY